MDLSTHLNNRVMAILPQELDRLCAKAKAAPDLAKLQAAHAAHEEKIAAAYGDSEKPRLRNGSIGDNGVAIINIKGVLFNVECYWDEMIAFYFGGTSYQSLMRDIDLVMNDESVKVVGFYVHSPGGEAFGMNETSGKISALTARKPTIGYAYGFAASAGYGLIAATGEIYADANAWVGSIGCVMNWMDFTGFYTQLGIAFEEVTSSNAPYKRLDIRIPEERDVFMQEIDGVEEVFIKKVAKDRNVTVEKVKSDFGKGAVMAGKAAKAAGMIDGIASWDEVVKQLNTKAKKANRVSADFDTKTGESMSLKQKLKEFFGSQEMQSILAEDDAADANAANDQPTATATETAKPASDAPKTPPAVENQTATAEQKLAAFKTEAGAFATGEIKAGRMSPREKDDFVENFAQAAFDDSVSPLASGSRLDRLKAQSANRRSSLLTEETVNSDANKVLLAQPVGASGDDGKKKLLSLTQLGKRTLKSQE